MKPRCEKFMPLSQVSCNRPVGHTGNCRKIDRTRQAAYDAAWYVANTERKAATTAAWVVANPERKAATNAAWAAANPDRVKASHAAWRAANPARHAAHGAAWVAANPERRAATNAAWAAANPERVASISQKRRAIKKGATVVPYTTTEYKARMAEFGDACYYCDLLAVVGPHDADDHFFPLQPHKGHRPGAHALWNLYPSCTKHNQQKHNKQPIDFINKLLETR